MSIRTKLIKDLMSVAEAYKEGQTSGVGTMTDMGLLLDNFMQAESQKSAIPCVMTRLISKNTIFKEAVSFAECNSKRDFEDTKASFIGGVNWLKGYLESNES